MNLQRMKNRMSKPNKKLHSPMHLLIDDIINEFNDKRKGAFGFWLGLTKGMRTSVVYFKFREVKASDVPPDEKIKLLVWKIKELRK